MALRCACGNPASSSLDREVARPVAAIVPGLIAHNQLRAVIADLSGWSPDEYQCMAVPVGKPSTLAADECTESVTMPCVRLTHDSEADAAYIYLVEEIHRGEVARRSFADIAMDNAAITIDFDADGRVLGIEVLGASWALRAETIRAAEDITRRT
jgi:uncharacterized protein YuzE